MLSIAALAVSSVNVLLLIVVCIKLKRIMRYFYTPQVPASRERQRNNIPYNTLNPKYHSKKGRRRW